MGIRQNYNVNNFMVNEIKRGFNEKKFNEVIENIR